MTTVSKKSRTTSESEEAPRYAEPRPHSSIETRFESAISALVDAAGMVTYVDPAVTAVLGRVPEEIVGRHVGVLVHPDDRDTMRRMLADLGRAPGASLSAEYRLRCDDGVWRWFEGSGVNLLHVPGVAAIVCTFRDITGRKLAPPSRWSDMGAAEHFVQFYEADEFLADSVGEFVSASLGAGEACVVIAAQTHRAAIETRLRATGVDLADAEARDAYIWLDAAGMLAQFMVDGVPDPARFEALVGGALARAARGGRRVRAFGEMVALLWAEGNAAAAVRLEEMWNDLRAVSPPFSLFCAYPIRGFAAQEHGARLSEICAHHGRVIPDESYTSLASADERLRAITLLQQKARSLEAEIAERITAQERLRTSESRYRRLFEASTDGILMVDPDTHIIADANPAIAAVLGYSREQLIGRELSHAGVFPDRAATESALRELRERNVVRYDMSALRTRDGLLRQVELVGNCFWTDGRDVIQYNVRDITERRQLERRTRAALDALLAMAETLVSAGDPPVESALAEAPDGNHALERVGVRAIAQRLAELTREVLGCEQVSLTTVEPATGRAIPLAVVGPSSELERTWWPGATATQAEDLLDESSVARLRAGEAVVVGVTPRPHPDLPAFAAERTLVAPMLLHGELVGSLIAGYGSVPHIYTSEEIALATAVAKLSTLVVERERLQQQREDARASALALQEANRRMDEFLGIASHELKTPVTAIKMNLQVMARRLDALQPTANHPAGAAELAKLAARIRQGIGHSERGIDRLMRVVGDLLDVSRIRAGELELRNDRCDLVTIAREVAEEQSQFHPNRTVRLDLPAADVPVSIVADADRIGQVITNYLTNALKYSAERRPVDLQVRVHGDSAWIGVRDRGPGLTAEEQARIWDLYYRAARVTVASGSAIGLGLGLHICKTMIERQGGRVGVESTVGKGSTFWFTLPLAPEAPTGERAATSQR